MGYSDKFLRLALILLNLHKVALLENGYLKLLVRLREVFSKGGLRAVFYMLSGSLGIAIAADPDQYTAWIKKRQKEYDSLIRDYLICDYANSHTSHQVSIIVNADGADVDSITRTIESLTRQADLVAGVWIICDDNSLCSKIESLAVLTRRFNRVKCLDSTQPNTGSLWEVGGLVDTTFSAYINAGDTLNHLALYHFFCALDNASCDVFYSDEDNKPDETGPALPFFKADASIDYLCSYNYLEGFVVFKSSLLAQSAVNDGIQSTKNAFHLAMLSAVASKAKVTHCPKVLSHRIQGNLPGYPQSDDSWAALLEQHLQKVYGAEAWVDDSGGSDSCCLPRYCRTYKGIKTSVIIPSKDQVGFLSECVLSILANANCIDYEIIILDNDSQCKEAKKWLTEIQRLHSHIKVVPVAEAFNWSRINNLGVEHSTGNVLVFLNNDTKVISPDWLNRISEQASRPDVGCVGGLLLFDDDAIQHAGAVAGFGGFFDHVYSGVFHQRRRYAFAPPSVCRNVLAVTGACMAIEKCKFEELNGFDERIKVCGGDVELCIRAHKLGYLNVYDPSVELYHFESQTRRKSSDDELDWLLVKKELGDLLLDGDPFYNVNLSLNCKYPVINVF